MAILETYSKRQKRLQNAGKQDVYQYDEFPEAFRTQVVHILSAALGAYFSVTSSGPNPAWTGFYRNLLKELGVFKLSSSHTDDPAQDCMKFILEADASGLLDTIEFAFQAIDRVVRNFHNYETITFSIVQTPKDAIEELNGRFKEHGLGYQYVDGILIRLDSKFAHAEIVKPALSLLNAAKFDGPADEFVRAFEHYRHGRNKEAIAEALKAFESTMKAICAARRWSHPPNATAKPLLDLLFQRGLIPADLESHFSGLRSAMESGLPTLSNKTSRHGQGAVPIEVPPHFAGYALHLMASNIIFLVEAHKALH
jgi:hypothetical protein